MMLSQGCHICRKHRMINCCNCYRTDGKRNDCYYHIQAMTATLSLEYAAIVVSVLYRMLTKSIIWFYYKDVNWTANGLSTLLKFHCINCSLNCIFGEINSILYCKMIKRNLIICQSITTLRIHCSQYSTKYIYFAIPYCPLNICINRFYFIYSGKNSI